MWQKFFNGSILHLQTLNIVEKTVVFLYLQKVLMHLDFK